MNKKPEFHLKLQVKIVLEEICFIYGRLYRLLYFSEWTHTHDVCLYVRIKISCIIPNVKNEAKDAAILLWRVVKNIRRKLKIKIELKNILKQENLKSVSGKLKSLINIQ